MNEFFIRLPVVELEKIIPITRSKTVAVLSGCL